MSVIAVAAPLAEHSLCSLLTVARACVRACVRACSTTLNCAVARRGGDNPPSIRYHGGIVARCILHLPVVRCCSVALVQSGEDEYWSIRYDQIVHFSRGRVSKDPWVIDDEKVRQSPFGATRLRRARFMHSRDPV